MVAVADLKGSLPFPLYANIILGAVEGALDEGGMGVLCNDGRLVALWPCPVVGIVSMFSCGVGETKCNCGALVFQQVALDSGIECVLGGVDACRDFHLLTIGCKDGFDLSVPEFLLLMDIFQLLELELTTFLVFEVEAYCSEIQTMWVHTEKLCSLLMTPVLCLLIFHCIDLLMPVAEIETFLTLRRCQAAGVFELVPPPVGHGVQGHTCPIIKREALQSSDVNRCGEMAVSDSERCQVVGLSDDGVVPIYNSVTVYRGRHVVYIVS